MQFKKNLHLAKEFSLIKTTGMIASYPKQYPTPKYLIFIREMLKNGYTVKVYTAGISKYIFIIKDDEIYKIRFSNHKPLYLKECENDCDFYVGISHMTVNTTEQIIAKILNK